MMRTRTNAPAPDPAPAASAEADAASAAFAEADAASAEPAVSRAKTGIDFVAPYASASYVDAKSTVRRAREMLSRDAGLPSRAWSGIAQRCYLHAQAIRCEYVLVKMVELPAGVVVGCPTWVDDDQRKLYVELLRLEGQARIAADVARVTPDDATVN